MRKWYALVLTCAFGAMLAGCQGLTEPPAEEVKDAKGKQARSTSQVLEIRETHGTVTPPAR